jgi:hypothetical protein
VRPDDLGDVESALIAYAKDREHRAAVASSPTAVELSVRSCTEGELDFLNLVTAQRNLYASQDDLVQATENLRVMTMSGGSNWQIADHESMGRNGPEREPQMNARTFVVLTVLALASAATGSASGIAAQIPSSSTGYIQPHEIETAFPFVLTATTLPAGKYVIEQTSRERLVFRSADGTGVDAVIATRLAQPTPPLTDAKVVFDKVNDRLYVSEIWVPALDGFLVGGDMVMHTHVTVRAVEK